MFTPFIQYLTETGSMPVTIYLDGIFTTLDLCQTAVDEYVRANRAFFPDDLITGCNGVTK